ncbi:Transcription factor TFIIIB component B'' like [Actinidia chinensis var. chinensis]|uniref:Transcription factor TFIIIB component B'' like n=1 Tax=Actinidia chinensis var. chinensis TaxID=1590841 RepID=A0A2R6S056_ACTCC|nr:Transcription factor TFIIIB component B'' like [Actinidia chinensis var. chinensis]
MGTDLDPLDEIFSECAANNARAGGKFRPKAKPRCRKESSAPSPSISVQAVGIAENKLSSLGGPSLASSETLEAKTSLVNNGELISGVHSSDDSALVNLSLEHHVIGETLGCNVGPHSDVITDTNGDLHSTTGKSAGQGEDLFFGLESLYEFYSQTPMENVDPGVELANEFAASCPANKHVEDSLACSEIPTVDVSDTKNSEEGPFIPVVSPLDDSAVRVSNTSSSYACPEVSNVQDPLTCEEACASSSDGGFLVTNRRLEIEESEAVPCFETLDNLFEFTTQSGQRSGKFQPKPKARMDREKRDAGSTSHPDGGESAHCSQNAQSIPSESEYINEGSIPAYPLDDVLESPSLRLGDSTSGLPQNEEPSNLVETYFSDALNLEEHPKAVPESLEKVSPSAKNRKRKPPMVSDDSVEHQKASTSGQENEAGRSKRQLRERTNTCSLVDEVHEGGNFTNRCSAGSLIDEYDNDCDEYQVPSESRNRKEPRKSNKSAPQKEKPVRKRKKSNEVPDHASKEPVKKFSHSTRRKRRQAFDKVLLEANWDDIVRQKLPIRDIILLAEYKERMPSKEGKTSEVPLANQSAGNPSEQGGSNKDQTNPMVEESFTYTNYQSYMNKTPRSRWSKQDTELFYEAVRQFGSDISMIQQLFPGRTRTQIKLKYKKEERQHPLRLHEALTTRAKDHSHFQRVIDHLQQVAAQEKQNSCRDDSIELTGDEEDLDPEINEEVTKSEQAEEGEVESVEPDVTEVQSPVKSYDSEDDLCRWSQYKSEL